MSRKYTSLETNISNIINRRNMKEDVDSSMSFPMGSMSMTPMPPSSNSDEDKGGSMAKIEMQAMCDMATELLGMMHENEELEPWVQAKIAIAKDNLTGIYHYMKYKR